MNRFKRKDGRQLCGCECKKLTNPGKRFILGHNMKAPKARKKKSEEMIALWKDPEYRKKREANKKRHQINYLDYQNLIYKLAHRFHKTTGIETDKLISCANIEFVKCQKSYNPIRASFSTYLYIKIRGLFLEMARKKNNNPEINSPYEKQSNNTADEYLFFKEILKSLSTDAKEVCEIVFNTPIDLIRMLPIKQPRGVNRHQIQKHLRRQGWTFTRIWGVFREIKESLIL